MKPAKEWYQQLPEPIRSEAIAEWEKSDIKHKHNPVSNIIEALDTFTWIKSPQGWDYWNSIDNRARNGEFDQPAQNLHGWIPVGERSPERLKDADQWDIACGRSEMVMVISPLFKYPQNAQYLHELKEWQTEHYANTFSNTTHWQPMPKLPEVKS